MEFCDAFWVVAIVFTRWQHKRRPPAHVTEMLLAVILPIPAKPRYPAATMHTSCCRHQREPEYDPDQPIKYSTSKARRWSSLESFAPPPRDIPWYQPYIVITSVAVFLIYFLILREENDLDAEVAMTLYERLPGLEEKQLMLSIDYESSQGHDTSALEARLKEIHGEK